MKTDEALRAFVDATETYTPRPNGGASSASIPYVLFADTRPVLTNLWLIKGVLPRRGVAVIYGGAVEEAWIGGAASGFGPLARDLLPLDRVRLDGCQRARHRPFASSLSPKTTQRERRRAASG
jgi:hypothetical protein